MIDSFKQSRVRLRDPYLLNAFQKEISYLMSFDSDRLLSCFRKTKGLLPKAENYSGWEDTEIRGHTMGHYLSALAQVYATTKDSTVYQRLQYILEELSLCQFESGYLSAFPEEFFDRVETGRPVWVPWYTMHKLISGLNTVYSLTDNETALNIVSGLGDWVYARTDLWTPEIQDKVLSVEYGGMNDCLYELYKLTGCHKYGIAAHKFDETALFTQIHEGRDVLNNRHANTTIPKFLGALNRYIVYGESEAFYLEASRRFWDMVTEKHSYVTGGNSEWEHFGEPDILDAERTEYNCETCNTYNMLKLSKGLFRLTGDRKYADFYENTFVNAILSSQNPVTGMTTYFQPMASGYFKVYSSPFDHFWCCTGTGMENFSKLNDSIYYYEGEKLIVNMYLASELSWEEKQVTILQDTDIPNTDRSSFHIHTEGETRFTLSLRLPSWAKGCVLSVNDRPAVYTEERGYALISRNWNDNDKIVITFEIEVRLAALPDNSNAAAFTYGPVVLSAGLGTESLETSITGVMVSIPRKQEGVKDYLIIKGKSISDWKENIAYNLIKTEGRMEFRLKGTDEDDNLCFTPHYRQHTQRYGIYWTLVEENSTELQNYIIAKRQAEKEKAAEIDLVQMGNDQYELSHHIHGKDTEAGDRDGFRYRYAWSGGWFSYEMKVHTHEDTCLQFVYMPGGCRDGFNVYINDTLLTRELRENKSWRELTQRTYLIPRELYGEDNTVTVRFEADDRDETGRIAGILRTTKPVQI